MIATGGLAFSPAGQERVEATVELYYPRSPSQWIPLPPLPRPRCRHATAILPDSEISLVLAGGNKIQSGKRKNVRWIDRDVIRDPIQGSRD